MRLLELPQPQATLCVTRQPCICDGDSPPKPECKSPEMVKRIVVRPDPCPKDLVGQRIALAATNDKPAVAVWPMIRRRHHREQIRLEDDGQWIDLPLGVIVGSATIQSSIPIVDEPGEHRGSWLQVGSFPGGPSLVVGAPPVAAGPFLRRRYIDDLDRVCSDYSFTDQFAYDQFTPGHHAWLLDDAAPTTERCPWCWGVTQFINDDFVVTDCPACNGAGTVEPIPSTSPDGTNLTEWTP